MYCSAKRSAKRAIYLAQSEQQRVFGEMLESEFGNRTLFKAVKQIVGKNRDVVGAGWVKGLDGRIVAGETEVKERWKDYFDKLLNEEFERNKEGLPAMDKVSGPAEYISCNEVKAAIASTKSAKAAGPSGVVAEMLKASGAVGIQWVTDLFNKIVQKGKIPSEWRKRWMVREYKGKGDAL